MDNFPPGMQGLIINSKVYEAVPLSGKETRCRDCALLDLCDFILGKDHTITQQSLFDI